MKFYRSNFQDYNNVVNFDALSQASYFELKADKLSFLNAGFEAGKS